MPHSQVDCTSYDSNYLGCDVVHALVGDIPSCVWHKAIASVGCGDNVKEDDDDAKPMQHQHPLNVSAIDEIKLKHLLVAEVKEAKLF